MKVALTIGGATFEVYAPRELSDQEIWRSILVYVGQHEIALGATYPVIFLSDPGESD